MKRNRGFRAFTLVETLVVIAIVGIVAAITFSALGSARESARQAKCISNLKQWGLALQMYRQEWDGIDPAPGLRITSLYQLGLPPDTGEKEFIKTYRLDNPGVFFCPSARPLGKSSFKGYRNFYTSYDDPPGGLLEAMFERGSEVPLMACTYHNAQPLEEDNPTDALLKIICLRYNQRVNVSFVKAYGVGTPYW